ncbi:MAG: hypothetical protein ACYTEU_13945 [Planctomycetota bacterium]|jgi:hypothetical protein
MMKLKKHTNILFTSLVFVFLFGCSSEHKQESSANVSSKESFKEAASPTLPLEDQIKAEKLLQLAQMEIDKSHKLRNNPKRGIETCREIIAQFLTS